MTDTLPVQRTVRRERHHTYPTYRGDRYRTIEPAYEDLEGKKPDTCAQESTRQQEEAETRRCIRRRERHWENVIIRRRQKGKEGGCSKIYNNGE